MISNLQPSFTVQPYDPSEAREKVRARIAYGLFAIITISIGYCFTLFYKAPEQVTYLKDVMNLVFSPTLTLFGTILGFYFGEKSNRS